MLGRHHQMHMIGHQHIGVNGTVIFPGLLGEYIEVVEIVLFCIEAGTTIIAALDNMPGDSRHYDTRASWHPGPPCPFAKSVYRICADNLKNRGLSPVVMCPLLLLGPPCPFAKSVYRICTDNLKNRGLSPVVTDPIYSSRFRYQL